MDDVLGRRRQPHSMLACLEKSGRNPTARYPTPRSVCIAVEPLLTWVYANSRHERRPRLVDQVVDKKCGKRDGYLIDFGQQGVEGQFLHEACARTWLDEKIMRRLCIHALEEQQSSA